MELMMELVNLPKFIKLVAAKMVEPFVKVARDPDDKKLCDLPCVPVRSETAIALVEAMKRQPHRKTRHGHANNRTPARLYNFLRDDLGLGIRRKRFVLPCFVRRSHVQ